MSIVPWEEQEEPVEDCTTTPTTIYDPDGTPVAWLNYNGPALIEEMLAETRPADWYSPSAASAWTDAGAVIADDLRRAWDRLVDAHFTEEMARERHPTSTLENYLRDCWLGEHGR